MGAIEIISGVAMLIVSLAIILLVVVQESPKGGGIEALSGGDSFFNQNQGMTKTALLTKATRIAAVVFLLVSIIAYTLLSRF